MTEQQPVQTGDDQGADHSLALSSAELAYLTLLGQPDRSGLAFRSLGFGEMWSQPLALFAAESSLTARGWITKDETSNISLDGPPILVAGVAAQTSLAVQMALMAKGEPIAEMVFLRGEKIELLCETQAGNTWSIVPIPAELGIVGAIMEAGIDVTLSAAAEGEDLVTSVHVMRTDGDPCLLYFRAASSEGGNAEQLQLAEAVPGRDAEATKRNEFVGLDDAESILMDVIGESETIGEDWRESQDLPTE